MRNEVLRVLNETKVDIADYRVTPAMLGRLIRMIDSGAIGGKAAKEVFDEMSATGDAPEPIVERKGLAQVSDPTAIREAARRILASNSAQVAQYRAGTHEDLRLPRRTVDEGDARKSECRDGERDSERTAR